MGAGNCDPDSASKSLQKVHQFLWSRTLPNGDNTCLKCGSGAGYLTWKDFRFGSDSIITSFRYPKNKSLIDAVFRTLPDYKAFFESYTHKSYTIGGSIIFPKHRGSINQKRGTNPLISDRWDLTLECIRRFYLGEDSPLYSTLEKDKAFFNLFMDFKGYVDFFFLQDCVSQDYSSVKIWLGKGDFKESPLPSTVEEYLAWIETELAFVEKRNRQITEYIISRKE